jgi:hypothetical protein
MIIQPLHLLTSAAAVAIGVFTCTGLLPDLDGADIQPSRDALVHADMPAEPLPVRSAPKSRPALGFELKASSHVEVAAWARDQELSCEFSAMGRRLTCRGAQTQLSATFDGAGHLTALQSRRWLDPERAEAAYADATQQLETAVGPATASVRPGDFVTGAYQRSQRRFDYQGYQATVTATHYGSRGLQLRERYRVTP